MTSINLQVKFPKNPVFNKHNSRCILIIINFKYAKQGNAEKATCAVYEVLKLGRLHNLLIKCQLNLFDKMVKPVLLYGCEIWGYG